MEQNNRAARPEEQGGIQDQLRMLLHTHHGNLLKQIDTLGQMLGDGAAHQAASVTAAEGLAHQIKGAGGSIGFAEISQAATVLDDQLKALVAQGGDASPEQMEAARALFLDLDRIARGTTPESSTLYNANLTRR
jgi:HPt (histidine-containing phosphotransfer) domain-containing protein